jgi:hypothetical protein
MENFQIAIPSYKRSKTLLEKTMPMLEMANIPPDKVTVFTNDLEPEETETYRQELFKDRYGKQVNIVKGVPTIGKQRNFIERSYPQGTKLVMIDDDITCIKRKVNDKKSERVDQLTNIIEHAFDKAEEVGAKLWGLYPVDNPLFMKFKYRTKLCYILGGFQGIIVEHDKALLRETNHGEDYEYSIRQYHKHKCVLRIEYLHHKTPAFQGAGGLQAYRNKSYILKSINQIQTTWPQYCDIRMRKNGVAELNLKDKKLLR